MFCGIIATTAPMSSPQSKYLRLEGHCSPTNVPCSNAHCSSSSIFYPRSRLMSLGVSSSGFKSCLPSISKRPSQTFDVKINRKAYVTLGSSTSLSRNSRSCLSATFPAQRLPMASLYPQTITRNATICCGQRRMSSRLFPRMDG